MKMKVHISNQNTKIGHIPNLSLPPKKSCPNCKFCDQKELGLKCYAVKAYVQYPNVRTAWEENFYMAKKWPVAFSNEIIQYLSQTKKK